MVVLQMHCHVDQRRQDFRGRVIEEVAGIHRDLVRPGSVPAIPISGAEVAVAAPQAGVRDQGTWSAIPE